MPSKQATTRSRRGDTGRQTTKRPARPAAGQRQRTAEVDEQQVEELLLQALETEKGGIRVYETAISCAVEDGLRKEWEKYLDETRRHERILTEIFGQRGIDTAKGSAGRLVVRRLGENLVQAMEMAKSSGGPEAAQCVAAECVVFAETKDHLNWQLIGKVAKATGSDDLLEAFKEVEGQEDEHLYHTMGWARELWLGGLGVGGQLPPPEEVRKAKSMISAGRAQKARKATSARRKR